MKVFHTDHLTGALKRISHVAARIREKFWWIDVIYPVALATLIFGCLTYIVYGGRESTRLSLLGERFLLEQSLRYTPDFSPQKPRQVVSVSIDPVKMSLPDRSHLGLTPDVTVEIYGRIIESLALKGLKNIVVLWRSENHPQDDWGYAYLREILAKVQNHSKVIFVTNFAERNGIRSFVGDLVQVVDQVPCANADNDEVQTYCPILKQNQEWIAQWLYQRFFLPAQQESEPQSHGESWVRGHVVPSWKTRYIPSTVEGYITRMSSPRFIEDVSAQAVLQNSFELGSQTSIGFIGVDLAGVMGSHIRPAMPIGITIPSAFWEPPENLSLHVYWASLTQSFIEGKIPTVASPLVIWIMNAAICGVIVLSMFRAGGLVASGILIFWYGAAPLLNVFFLSYANFYAPIFNSYYLSLSLLTFSGFARLSFTALGRWRAEEKSRSLLDAADLKANFISLLSHNINTPIAKMQGMLDLLSLGKDFNPDSSDLFQARFYLAQLQLVIKSVLMATTLEEKAVSVTLRTVKNILDDFQNSFGPLVEQLGVQLTMGSVLAEHEDLLHLPLGFDSRVLSTALAAMVGLGASLDRPGSEGGKDGQDDKKNRKISLIPVLVEEPDEVKLIFIAEIKDAQADIFKKWFASANIRDNGLRGVQSEDFVRGVFAGLISLTADFYAGYVKVEESSQNPQSVEIQVELRTTLR